MTKTESHIQQAEEQAQTVRDSLSTNVVVDIATRIGYLVTRFFIPPFVLAHVGLPSYGLWSAAFIIVAYLGVSTIGVSNVYIKYTAEHAATRNYARANQLLSTGLLLAVPVCTLLFVLLVAFWPAVEAYLNIPGDLRGEAHEVVLIVVATFLVSIAFSVYKDVLTGLQRLAHVQLVWAAAYVIETALIFALVGSGRGIRGLAEAFLIRTLLEVGATAVLAYKTVPWLSLHPRNYSSAEMRTLLSFGGAVQLLGFLAIALNSIERMLAAPLIGLQATGLLDIGKKLPSMAASIPSAFASSLIPAASYLQAGGSEGERRGAVIKLYLKGARYMNLAAAYICGFLAAMPGPILGVWLGRDYPGAGFLVVIFAVSTQIHLMTGPGTSILRGIGRPYAELHYALPNVIALAFTLAASRAIQGGWTTPGIGTAVAAATVLSAVWFIAFANRRMGVRAPVYLRAVVVPGLIPYAVALSLAIPTNWLVAGSSRWAGAGIVVLAGVVYTLALALIVMRLVFETGERLWFLAVVRNRLGRFLPRSVQEA